MPTPPSPEPNATASASLTVTAADLASALSVSPGDDYPAVFATSRMIALMEIASARILMPCIQPGQLSVGARVDVVHSAPTPVGAEVTARAKYLGRKGKLFAFEVVAEDEGGEIGRGTHERAIVDGARIMEGAGRRGGGKGKL